MNKMVEERTLKCFRDENSIEYYIAYDEQDVWAVWEEHIGEKRDDYDFEWEEVSPSVRLCIVDDEMPHTRYRKLTRTVAEWIEEKGRGFLCSEEY